MKRFWKRFLSISCIVAILMTMPGVTILADELIEDNQIVNEEEDVSIVHVPVGASSESESGELSDNAGDIEIIEDDSVDELLNPTESLPDIDSSSVNNDESIYEYYEQPELEIHDDVKDNSFEGSTVESITESLEDGLADFLYPDISEDVELANNMIQTEELVGSINDSFDNPYINEEMLLKTYDFDIAKYRADILINYNESTISSYMSIRNPSEILVDKLENNVGFMTDVTEWEIWTFDPATAGEKIVLDKVQYYELILFNILNTQLNNNIYEEIVAGSTTQSFLETESALLSAAGVDYKGILNNKISFEKYMADLNKNAAGIKLNKLTLK